MQDTLSDKKEFSGSIIGGANAALLLQVCEFHVAASHWPATMVSKHCLVQAMSPWIKHNHTCVACSCMQRDLSAHPPSTTAFFRTMPQLLPFACLSWKF
jgi:hypothetical protein